ncbi:PH domain-containing protein [Alkalicoccobacillus porphyridii]|uniref:PH domain-containing protein n=1 Tax=Alkalicoccobacillus porphyridii TaxID=2597270 RepID=A0A554A1M6_9BACI|nr:PH domain-containing protein [Alkalicoccobacillus porphyridii]TSB47594.1 PH domain-containing protein [Alkalicoccobacillus porphyridii]
MNLNGIELHKAYRLHYSFIVTDGISSIKAYIFPLILLWFVNANSSSTFITIGKWGVLALLLITLCATILHWLHFSYEFRENELHIIKGGFIKKEQTIAYKHIQNISKETNFVGRWFHVTSVKLETEAQSNSTVDLKMISIKQAEHIQAFLSLNEKRASGLVNEEQFSEERKEKKQHYLVTNKELIIASFTSVSSFALIPLLVGLFFNVDEWFSLDGYVETVWPFLLDHLMWLVSAVIILLIISVSFGLILTFIRYGHFEVRSDNERIYIKKGLFQTKEYSILRHKVQGVSVSKTLIRRWFGIVDVKLICAAGGLGEEGIESSVLFPFLAQSRLYELLQEIVPNYALHPPELKLPRQVIWVRLLTPSYFWVLVSVIVWIQWSDLWYISPLLLAWILAVRLFDYAYSRYRLSVETFQAQSGVLSLEWTTTNMTKIDEVRIEQTWLQRRWGLATLQVETRGSQGTTIIRDLPYEQANEYYGWYAAYIQNRFNAHMQTIQVLNLSKSTQS